MRSTALRKLFEQALYGNANSKPREKVLQEVQQLEDSYAEALADGADARTLSGLWDEIKKRKKEFNLAECI